MERSTIPLVLISTFYASFVNQLALTTVKYMDSNPDKMHRQTTLIEKSWIVVKKSGQLHPFTFKFVIVIRNHQ